MLLDKWVAESMAKDHAEGITHGAGMSSTGAIWCPFCYRAWASREATRRATLRDHELGAGTPPPAGNGNTEPSCDFVPSTEGRPGSETLPDGNTSTDRKDAQ